MNVPNETVGRLTSDDLELGAVVLTKAADIAREADIGDLDDYEREPMTDAAGVTDFMQGDGADVAAFLQWSSALWSDDLPDPCKTVLEKLREGPSPEDLTLRALSAPDPETGDALVNVVTAVNRRVSDCDSEQGNAGAALAWAIATTRLSEAGVEL